MTKTNPPAIRRGERTLVYMLAGIGGVSVLCMIASLIAGAAGASLWPIILVFPLFGLPIVILLLLVLVITYAVRRSREARSVR